MLKSFFYTYNDQGRIEMIYTPVLAHPIASYTWTEEGKISLLVRGGVEERWTYTSSGRIKNHTARRVDEKPGQTIYSQKLWYNPQGMAERRMTETEFFEKDELFEYDYLWRLTGAKTNGESLGALGQVLYDANGNILQAARSGNELKAVLEEGTNRLASVLIGDETLEFGYGDNGNPVSWRGIRCGYDACGTQLNELDTGQEVIRFVRGSRDEPLIWMTDHSVNMRYRRSDGVPLFIWDGQNTSLCIPGQDLTAAIFGKDGVRYPISDPSGTVWAVADQCGHLTAAFDYEPFGSVVGHYGAEEEQWPFLFHGKEWLPEVSLYIFGSRLYDPALMRFLTQDPARQFATPYVFLGNNPLVLVDPSGNMTKLGKIFSAVGFFLIAAVGVVASIGIAIATAGAATPAAALAIGFFGGMAAGAVTGVGMSGGFYCASTPADKFSNKELGKVVWQGAVNGAISGAISGFFGAGINLGLQGAASSTIIITHLVTDSLVNGASNVITSGTMASINGTNLSGTDLLITAGIGCAVGLVSGFLSGVKACTLNDAVTSGANAVTQKLIDVSSKVNGFLDKIGNEVKALTCSDKIVLGVSALTLAWSALIIADVPMEYLDVPEQSNVKKVRASYLHLDPA